MKTFFINYNYCLFIIWSDNKIVKVILKSLVRSLQIFNPRTSEFLLKHSLLILSFSLKFHDIFYIIEFTINYDKLWDEVFNLIDNDESKL